MSSRPKKAKKVSTNQLDSLISQIREKYGKGEITITHLRSFVGRTKGERDADASDHALTRFHPDIDRGGHD